MDALKKYLDDALGLFESDPPDSDFQEGYHEALSELYRVFVLGNPSPPSKPAKKPLLKLVEPSHD